MKRFFFFLFALLNFAMAPTALKLICILVFLFKNEIILSQKVDIELTNYLFVSFLSSDEQNKIVKENDPNSDCPNANLTMEATTI